jgi:hypothetical protein
MGLILICIVILTIGVVGSRVAKNYSTRSSFEVVAGFGLIFSIVISGGLLIQRASFICENQTYDLSAKQIEMSMNNDRITENERLSTIDKVNFFNDRVLTTKCMIGNFFVGAFYNPYLLDKELFDFNKIPQVKYNFIIKTDSLIHE